VCVSRIGWMPKIAHKIVHIQKTTNDEGTSTSGSCSSQSIQLADDLEQEEDEEEE